MVKNHKRTDTSADIIEAGYDIAQNASWLQDFYLKRHQKAFSSREKNKRS